MSASSYDAVVIGGGIIGFATAAELVRRAKPRTLILEKESEVGTGATSKATGGIRHQFSTEVNVRLTQLSYQTFLTFADEMGQDIGFRAHGYLMVASTPASWDALRRSAELQQRLGVPTEVLTPQQARDHLGPLRVDDLLGATFCALDASASPTDALQGYRKFAREHGIEVRTGEAVTAIDVRAGRVEAVRTSGGTYPTQLVVDAAGPYLADVARLVGLDVPARPFRRQIFVVAPVAQFPRHAPLLVDLDSGWYVHQDSGGTLLLGGTDKNSRPGLEPVVDWDAFDLVAEAASRRMPTIAPLMQLRSAYCGIRTLTPDFHGIAGRTPVRGFFLASNCNGHGFMHAPGLARVLAEEIIDGAVRSLDMTPLRLERFANAKPHAEAMMF
jgi:sarcosine oxidase subunit beta